MMETQELLNKITNQSRLTPIFVQYKIADGSTVIGQVVGYHSQFNMFHVNGALMNASELELYGEHEKPHIVTDMAYIANMIQRDIRPRVVYKGEVRTIKYIEFPITEVQWAAKEINLFLVSKKEDYLNRQSNEQNNQPDVEKVLISETLQLI